MLVGDDFPQISNLVGVRVFKGGGHPRRLHHTLDLVAEAGIACLVLIHLPLVAAKFAISVFLLHLILLVLAVTR